MPVVDTFKTGYRGVSPQAAREHYDVSDEFFRLWLGPSLSYSSALWSGPDDDLESAQERKLSFIAESTGLRTGARVLDVGCGYGTELTGLLTRHGARAGVGLTLSEKGAEHIRRAGVPGIEPKVENWATFTDPDPFDLVVSLEAFEHFARPGLSRAAKVRSYRTFFRSMRHLIRDDGRFFLQTITWGHRFPLDPAFLARLRLATQVYPECNPSFFTEIIEAADGLFDIEFVRNDHEHYARTTRAWVDNLEASWTQAVDLVGGERAEGFRDCMEAAAGAFAEGWFYLLRLVLRPVSPPVGPARKVLINRALGTVPGLR